MPSPVYSERLIVAPQGAANTVHQYTIPSGKRAIVKQFVASNNSGTAGGVFFYVNGSIVWRRAVAGDVTMESPTMFIVVYAGEILGALVTTAGLAAYAYGYLFSDA